MKKLFLLAMILLGGVPLSKTFADEPIRNNGHFWVLDGYYKDEYIIDLYLYIHGRDELIPDGSIGPFTTRLNHINWGWYGVNNGYFDDGVFNTYSVQLPDTPDNYASYNFNNCLWTLAVDIAN